MLVVTSFRPAPLATLLPIAHLSCRDCLMLRNSSKYFPLDKEYPSCNLMQTVQPVLYAFKQTRKGHRLAYLFMVHLTAGTAVAQWLRCCATNRKVAGLIPAGVSGFFIEISFRSHYGPGVDSACNRNEYQEHFLGVKAAGA